MSIGNVFYLPSLYLYPRRIQEAMRVRVDELRDIKGLTVDELARAMGVSRIYLQSLKGGKNSKRFNQTHFESMLKIFNCSVHDLFEDDVPKPRLLGSGHKESNPFDELLLEDAIALIEKEPVKLTPANKAKAISALYELGLTKENRRLTAEEAKPILRLVIGGKR